MAKSAMLKNAVVAVAVGVVAMLIYDKIKSGSSGGTKTGNTGFGGLFAPDWANSHPVADAVTTVSPPPHRKEYSYWGNEYDLSAGSMVG